MEDPHRRLIEKRYFSPRGKRRKSRTGANRRPVFASSPKGTALWRGKTLRAAAAVRTLQCFFKTSKRIARTCR